MKTSEGKPTQVTVSTTLLLEEVVAIDRFKYSLGGNRYGRRGALRLMLRFALEHEEQMTQWFHDTDGKPVEGGED